MPPPLPHDIEAEITFLPASAGGRGAPVSSGYSPQSHYAGHDWDALHTYPDADQVHPGDTVRAWLTFFSPEEHFGKLHPGDPFLLREGRHVVAYGKVTRILDLPSSAHRAESRRK
jgi:translation elongation factor EF-Tu-like GTPase